MEYVLQSRPEALNVVVTRHSPACQAGERLRMVLGYWPVGGQAKGRGENYEWITSEWKDPPFQAYSPVCPLPIAIG